VLVYNSPVFSRDGNRPGSHLNIGTLVEIIKDVMKKGVMNDAEDIIINCAGTTVTGAKSIAQYMKGNNVLSGQDMAVCHKVPYAAVERALEALLNKRAVTNGGWAMLKMFWGALYPPHGYSSQIHNDWYQLQTLADQVYNKLAGSTQEAAAAVLCLNAANTFLREFDGCDDNLYFGFQGTNAGIGDRLDLHYNIHGPGIGAVTATPRGINLMNTLNALEVSVGLGQTAAVEQIDKALKIKWQKNSGAATATTIGWVEVT
jgi:hypothetical protein